MANPNNDGSVLAMETEELRRLGVLNDGCSLDIAERTDRKHNPGRCMEGPEDPMDDQLSHRMENDPHNRTPYRPDEIDQVPESELPGKKNSLDNPPQASRCGQADPRRYD